MNFFKNMFSNESSKIIQQIEDYLTKIGKTWAKIEANRIITPEENSEAAQWFSRLGITGKRNENLFALLKRHEKRNRFIIHRKRTQWRLDLWTGTLKTSGPPDLEDQDGNEFYRQDVINFIIIIVTIPTTSEAYPYYTMYIEDKNLEVAQAAHENHKFSSPIDLVQKLSQIQDKLTI